MLRGEALITPSPRSLKYGTRLREESGKKGGVSAQGKQRAMHHPQAPLLKRRHQAAGRVLQTLGLSA